MDFSGFPKSNCYISFYSDGPDVSSIKSRLSINWLNVRPCSRVKQWKELADSITCSRTRCVVSSRVEGVSKGNRVPSEPGVTLDGRPWGRGAYVTVWHMITLGKQLFSQLRKQRFFSFKKSWLPRIRDEQGAPSTLQCDAHVPSYKDELLE